MSDTKKTCGICGVSGAITEGTEGSTGGMTECATCQKPFHWRLCGSAKYQPIVHQCNPCLALNAHDASKVKAEFFDEWEIFLQEVLNDRVSQSHRLVLDFPEGSLARKGAQMELDKAMKAESDLAAALVNSKG